MRVIEHQDHIDEALSQLCALDSRLADVAAIAGPVPLRRSEPGFAALCSIVCAQQVSKQAGDAILGRLETLVDPLTPDNFIAAGEEAWRAAGLSRPKQRTLVNVAEAIACRSLDLHALCALPAEEAIAAMTAVKGIGPWTAEVYLLFAAGHPDIFPAGDIALQNAAQMAFGLDERPADKALRDIAAQWSPWRGVAARMFWAYYGAMRRREVAPAA